MSDMFFLPYRPVYDTSTRIIPGAQVYFTLSGTNTASAPFADDALATPLANPVVANGVGRIPTAYLDSAINYRVRVYAAGAEAGVDTPLEEYDPYTPGVIIAEFEGGGVSFGTITGLSTVTTRGLLAAVPTAEVMVSLSEAGREGLFKWSGVVDLSAKVTADPEQGIYVPPTAANGSTGAWVRQFDVRPVDPRWWGFSEANTAAANTTAVNAMFVCLKSRAANVITNYQGLEPIRFPLGDFDLNATIELTDGTGIFEGVDTGFPAGHGTILNFPAGVTGIRVQRYNTSGAGGAAGASHRGGDGAHIRGIALQGSYVATEAEAHGIQLRARAIIENVYIKDFEGDGIYGDATAGGAVEGNANSARIVGGRITGCRKGIFIDGADTNIWTITGTDCSSNRAQGFDDRSFLGNDYFGTHASANGLIPGTTPTVVSDGTYRYGVIVGQEVGASTNAPSGTTVDNTWWYYLSAGAASVPNNIPLWVSGTTYRVGGSYFADNANARNSFFGCYAESGQGLPQIASPSTVYGGAGIIVNVGTGAVLYGGSNGYVFTERGFKVQREDEISTAEYTLGEGGLKTTIRMITDTVVAPLTYREKFNGNDIQFDYQNVSTNRVWLISGYGTGQQFGTGAAVLYAFYPTKLMVGDTVTNARQISNGTVVPASGTHGPGEMVFNRTPTMAGVSAWRCSAVGTPGTWFADYNYPRADPTTGIGYVTGAGGAVTQATSRTTGVTLDKVCGAITLVSAAGSATWAAFTVTNSAVAATDTIRVVQKSGTDKYMTHVTAVGAGSFEISFATTGGTTTEQPVLNFAVVKAVAA